MNGRIEKSNVMEGHCEIKVRIQAAILCSLFHAIHAITITRSDFHLTSNIFKGMLLHRMPVSEFTETLEWTMNKECPSQKLQGWPKCACPMTQMEDERFNNFTIPKHLRPLRAVSSALGIFLDLVWIGEISLPCYMVSSFHKVHSPKLERLADNFVRNSWLLLHLVGQLGYAASYYAPIEQSSLLLWGNQMSQM